MDRFVSNVTNRLDAKGRVSVPAGFRAVLARDGYEGVFAYPAFGQPAMDCGGRGLIAEIDALLSGFPAGSEERDELSLATFGTSEILRLDGEGRIGLTDTLKAHAGITDGVTFVGLGTKFQLWEPERFRVHLGAARARVRGLRHGVSASSPRQVVPPGARDT